MFTVLALRIISTHLVEDLIIFGDSRSGLSALQSYAPSVSSLVLSAQEWLYLLNTRAYHDGFYWLPGHIGIVGNKRVDEIALEAAAHAVVTCPAPCTYYSGP